MGWCCIYGWWVEVEMKNKVHIVLRAKFGLPQDEFYDMVEHTDYQDLVNKLESVFIDGRDLMIVINEGIVFVDPTTYNQIGTQELTAVFHSRQISSVVHVTAVIQGDNDGPGAERRVLGSRNILHFGLGDLQFGIGNLAIGGEVEFIFQLRNRRNFEITHATYSDLHYNDPVHVHIYYPLRPERLKGMQAGSFFDTASSFQQRVLQFKATPRGPS
jgi:hypothetical protein